MEGCLLTKPLFPDSPALVCVYKGKHDSEFHSSLMRETETETDKGRGGASSPEGARRGSAVSPNRAVNQRIFSDCFTAVVF